MLTFYVATNDRGNQILDGLCEGHGSIREAVKCRTAASDYVYAVENGTPRSLTPEEEQEVKIYTFDS